MALRIAAFAVWLLCSALLPRAASAQGVYGPIRPRDIVIAYNRGPRLTVAPGVFLPTHGGRVGFSVAGDVRYGFVVGPTVLAPGLRVAGYFPSDERVVAGFATLRATVPIGPVGPYVLGGVGPAYVSDPARAGFAYLAGGGFMVHIGLHIGVGAEATYQAVVRRGFGAVFVGPTLLFSF